MALLAIASALALVACVEAEPPPLSILSVTPASLRVDIPGRLVLSGSGLVGRRRYDPRAGRAEAIDVEFTLFLDGVPYAGTPSDDGTLPIEVGPMSGSPRTVLGTLRSPTGAEAALPGPIVIVGSGPPVVLSVEPATGRAAGGERIVIRGVDLGSRTRIWFGDEPMTDAAPISPDALAGTLPPGTPGARVPVRALNPDWSDFGVKVDAFGYLDVP